MGRRQNKVWQTNGLNEFFVEGGRGFEEGNGWLYKGSKIGTLLRQECANFRGSWKKLDWKS